MSLLDSFARSDSDGECEPEAGVARSAVGGPSHSVLDSFCDAADLFAAPPRIEGVDPHCGMPLRDRPLPEPPEHVEVLYSGPKSKRGRPMGTSTGATTLRRLLAGDAPAAAPVDQPPMSRKEICIKAGKARQAKRRAQSAPPRFEPVSLEKSSGLEVPCALVPLGAAAASDKLSMYNNTEA